MPSVKYVLLLPLNYNDGSEIPKPVRDQFLADIYVLAGGHTVAGTVEGAYRMKSGKKQTDHALEIWIAVEEADEPALKHLVATYAGILKQESLYLERTASTVEFIAPLTTGETAP